MRKNVLSRDKAINRTSLRYWNYQIMANVGKALIEKVDNIHMANFRRVGNCNKEKTGDVRNIKP